jgi:hypothetical protein
MLSSTYPLIGDQKPRSVPAVCGFEFDKSFGQVSGGPWSFIPFTDDAIVNHLLSEGPIVAMIDGRGLNTYHKGIWDGTWKNPQNVKSSCSQNVKLLNLSILLVGIGLDQKTGEYYYRAKNSWGTGWGEQGYFR